MQAQQKKLSSNRLVKPGTGKMRLQTYKLVDLDLDSRQGPRTGASHRRGDDYGAALLDSRLLNSAKEPADTTD